MHPTPFLLSGFLLLASATLSLGQTVPAPPEATPVSLTAAAVAPSEATPDRLLLKIGLNAGRSLRWGGYYGLAARLPVSLAAEYALSSKVTVYGQLDADFRLSRQNAYFGDQDFFIPTGALGVGARYYYNQAGRERHNRSHGPFVGNYLALEAHAEGRQRYGNRNDLAPGLNLLWGMQRRLGRNFLFDFNAGAGLGPLRTDSYIGYSNGGNLNITTQFNLGIYFGR